MSRTAIVVGSMLAIATVGAFDAAAQTPAQFYEQRCRACHSIGGGPALGPDLKGVTERKDRQWLAQFIVDPRGVYESGDPYAAQIVAEWKGRVMPRVRGLTPEMADALIDYIEAQTRSTPTAPVPLTITSRPFTQEDVRRGHDLFTGATRFDAGGPACIGCHHVGEMIGFGGGTLGPDLTAISSRLQGRAGLGLWLSAPESPTMRALYSTHKLTPDEVESLLALFEAAEQTATTGPSKLLFLTSGAGGAAVGLLLLASVWRRRFRAVRRPLAQTATVGGTR